MKHLRWAPFALALAAIAAFVLLVGLVVAILEDEELNACGQPVTPGVAVTADIAALGTVAGFSGEQLQNAAAIMNAGAALGISQHGQTVGVMTAIGESTLRVLDRGDAVGPDSRGLFQQRDNGAWGTYADRMDPTISATNFFRALLEVPGWETLPPTLAAHRTQRNADPNHYAKFWGPAQQIVAALTGGATANAPPQPQPITQPGIGTAPVSNSAGPLSEATQVLADEVWAANLGILSIGGTRGSAIDMQGHPSGNAVDLMVRNRDRVTGDRIVAYLQQHADRLGVDYVIWWQRIWTAGTPNDAWRQMATREGGDTANHYDHPHVNTLPGFVPGLPAAAQSQLGALPCPPPAAPAGTVLVADGTWTRPSPGRITSGFGPRWGAQHNGLDFGATCGTPVLAASSGTVVGVHKNNRPPATGYGTLIVIDHGSGIVTRYAHAANEDVLVTLGQQVSGGDQIARTGTYGQSTGCHLHFEVQEGGAFRNPQPFLDARGVPVAA